MRIALLNLPVDNNYGGNLQRYALIKVLQDMGHDVTHIFLKNRQKLPWYKIPYSYTKRIFLKFILRKDVRIRYESFINNQEEKKLKNILPFYSQYIKHTKCCYSIRDVKSVTKGKFDSYIVGSDQVWRKCMSRSLGWEHFLLKFTWGEKVKRIAYAVSFGTNYSEYDKKDCSKFNKLYSAFDIVSVREESALEVLESIGCDTCHVSICLDPTLLLSAQDWLDICNNSVLSRPTKGKIFCYILDMTVEIDRIISEKSSELNLEAIIAGISDCSLSIPEWLLSIHDADFIITDSYHGTVFSIIFKKQFLFCGNSRRGNSRISSLFNILNIRYTKNGVIYDENVLTEYKKKSISFLKNNLI